ncbi:MAG TPA: Uma2 family endonuclease [Phycisphaerae bacterium]|jgi:Uma2 family endonuclease
MTTAATLLTAEQFAEQFGNIPFCELVRGEVVELTARGLIHSRTVGRAYFLVETWARQSGLGRAFTGETGVFTEHDPDTVRGADIAYFSYGRLPRETELPSGFSRIPPELVIEVLGKGHGWDEMYEKVSEYLRAGVDAVWVLDPDSRSLSAFRPNTPPVVLEAEAEIRDEALLPGFSCHDSQFFED